MSEYYHLLVFRDHQYDLSVPEPEPAVQAGDLWQVVQVIPATDDVEAHYIYLRRGTFVIGVRLDTANWVSGLHIATARPASQDPQQHLRLIAQSLPRPDPPAPPHPREPLLVARCVRRHVQQPASSPQHFRHR